MPTEPFREPKRARRIRDRARMQARAERLAARIHGYDRPEGEHLRSFYWTDLARQRRDGLPTWADVFEARAAWARRSRDHLASCSCWGCGNPRRHFAALTLPELRAAAAAAEQIAASPARPAPRHRGRAGWW